MRRRKEVRRTEMRGMEDRIGHGMRAEERNEKRKGEMTRKEK